MAQRIYCERFVIADDGSCASEVLAFKSYEPGVDAPGIAHTPPGARGLWVFERFENALWDNAALMAALPSDVDGVIIPPEHNYWRPLGTADGKYTPLPLMAGLRRVTREQFNAHVEATREARGAAMASALFGVRVE